MYLANVTLRWAHLDTTKSRTELPTSAYTLIASRTGLNNEQ